MDVEKLKLLITNLEVTLNELKLEVYGDNIGEEYLTRDFSSPEIDYDEIFDDE